MNGPEHYREAERLLVMADNPTAYDASQQRTLGVLAQAHATLALVAATVNQQHHDGIPPLAEQPGSWDNKHRGDGPTWGSVTV